MGFLGFCLITQGAHWGFSARAGWELQCQPTLHPDWSPSPAPQQPLLLGFMEALPAHVQPGPSQDLTGAPMQVYCDFMTCRKKCIFTVCPCCRHGAPETFGISCDDSSKCVFRSINGWLSKPLQDGTWSPEEPAMWLEGRNRGSHHLTSEEGREAESVINGQWFHQSHLCNEASIRSQWTGFGKLPDWWTRCIHLLLGEAPNSTGTKATVYGTSP